jgi:hypothetical protein
MLVDSSRPSGSHPFTLIGADGVQYLSPIKGNLGGHRRNKIFGRLDCLAALRAIARGGYVSHRVFFVDADTAKSAGYRPCATCMPDAYREWKTTGTTLGSRSRSRPS